MRKFFIVPAAVLLLMSTACGPTLKVTSDYNKSADFSTFKTYSIHSMEKAGVSSFNRQRIENAIVAQMTAKGYTPADTLTADLLVNAVTITKQGKNVTAYTDYYGYGGYYRPYYWGAGFGGTSTTNFSVDNYTDGSLIIDVVDRNKKELIWQGVGNSEIDGTQLKDPDNFIPKAVTKIMESFPAKK